ncbi:hypothetical protein GUITHDRAFT_149767 [Guillardia theta CCMP2712]|uniref:Uncharacterized protein n=1 Tax=Guillardia theta (strain CCMP2712) TaxID=905079 RepID=L1K4P8_GUITC|nr:hypothetical protein GUITHDRAFT_149767 [Guillardia theta CCMP2712]EKX55313.1 hypothetical protein GUITHDRAFT_149767 [Guillardia theta CCMP2712]|eukprot:XP_005842293.1 hypothetical protein GUITHDRAFT_149767 [Guillardia theta CCMP2712]
MPFAELYSMGKPPSFAQVEANPEKAMKQVLAMTGPSHSYSARSRWDKSASCAWNHKMCKI